MIEEARKLANAAAAKASRILRRGLLKVSTAAGFCQVEGAASGEDFDNVELWSHFGFFSRPPANTEMLIGLVDGNDDQPIAFAGTNRASRPSSLAVGDAALFGEKSGNDQAIVITRAAGGIDLEAGTGEYVNVGGDTEKMILGETAAAALRTFANSCAGSADGTLAAAATILSASLGASGANWLSSKAKLS